MFKKIGFWVLIACFAGAVVLGYLYLANAKKPKITAAQALPDDCIFVIESSDYFKLWKKLNETNLIWQELQQINYFSTIKESGKLADSVLYSNEAMRAMLSGKQVYMACVEAKGGRDYVYALNVDMDKADAAENFVKSIAENISTQETEKLKEKYLKFKLKAGAGFLYLYCKNGLVLLSPSAPVLEKSINCIGHNCLGNDAGFVKAAEMAGAAVDFRFFLNLSQTEKVYSEAMKQTTFLQHIASAKKKGWMETDVDFKPNEMKLNGFTVPDSTSLLHCLTAQSPQEMNFVNAAPQSTDNFLFLGTENFKGFYEQAEKTVVAAEEKKEYDEIFEALKEKTGLGLKLKIIGAVGEEVVALRASFSDSVQDNFCMIKLEDREQEEENFHLLADSVLSMKVQVNDAERKDSVYFFKQNGLLKAITLGMIERDFHYSFFYEDYLLFCESPSAWKRYLNEVTKGKVLSENENYQRFRSGNIGEESNVYLYSFLSSSKKFVSGFFGGTMKEEMEKHAELFDKFHSFGFQMSSYKGLLLNQGYVLYSPIYNIHNNTVWEVKLDSAATMIPKIVLNHKTGLEEIFTQDVENKIYLLSSTGKILWKRRIDGPVISEVHQVDFFQNNKLQYLFNTEKAIYMIDRNGNDVSGYPVILETPATNGIAVFDYEKNRDYRIVFCDENKKVNIYRANGKMVEGFEFTGTTDFVKAPVQWERVNNKDYLLVRDVAGNMYGLGRKGEKRLGFDFKVPDEQRKVVMEYGKDIDKTKMCFYDVANASIVKVWLNNKKQEVKIATDLAAPAAFFCRVNDDDYYDLILVEGDKIEIYDDAGNLMQKITAPEKLKPVFKQLQKNNEFFYAFVSQEDNLYVFSANWSVPEKSAARCALLPAIEMLNDDGYFYMIGIRGALVSCYPF